MRRPPYAITPAILRRAEEIGEAIGRAEAAAVWQDLRLRRTNRVRTIHGSLAIEGNRLSEDQIATILDGKPVVGPLRDIQEARNAIEVYDRYQESDPANESHMLRAHEILMRALLDAPGRYRSSPVVVMGGDEVQHIGPPANRVPGLVAGLLQWLAHTDEHPLISSSVFHYEFEFIHPFEDGNGRMGRLWQTLILIRWNPLFATVPVEGLIHAGQDDYHRAIRESSAAGESTRFIKYMLDTILAALQTPQVTPQVARLLTVLHGTMSRRQIQAALGLRDHKSLRQRYLLPALNWGYVEMTRPDAPSAANQKYRLTELGRQAKAYSAVDPIPGRYTNP